MIPLLLFWNAALTWLVIVGTKEHNKLRSEVSNDMNFVWQVDDRVAMLDRKLSATDEVVDSLAAAEMEREVDIKAALIKGGYSVN